jgi:DCN1-like protein 1/2
MSNQTRQKELSQQLASLAGITSRQAATILKKYDYKLDRAADAIYSGRIAVEDKNNSKSVGLIEKIFNKYKESDEEIGIEGTIQFIQDLGLQLEDPVVLAIAYHLQAPSVGHFIKDQFITGWLNLQADSLSTMKTAVAGMDHKLKEDDAYFANVYKYTFVFNLQEGQRILGEYMAIIRLHGSCQSQQSNQLLKLLLTIGNYY